MSDHFTKSRVEAFSDGVFAIIITLLILEIKVPEIHAPESVGGLAEQLLQLAPKFIAWVISFMITAVIWANHHRVFDSLKTIDHGVFWLNINLLLWCCFVPFPTAMVGDYPNNRLAVSFFGFMFFMMGLSFSLLRAYMWRVPEVTKDFSKENLWVGLRNAAIFGALFYLAGALSAWIHPYIAYAFYIFVPVYFIFPSSTALRPSGEN